ncbi:hypothetical protein EDD16DRAFT_1800168 [Pisolithus croceorrhizus]|nr:hypothetical protein EDD16DRAFT_1800168 [Pisolithus croceorrhizus]
MSSHNYRIVLSHFNFLDVWEGLNLVPSWYKDVNTKRQEGIALDRRVGRVVVPESDFERVLNANRIAHFDLVSRSFSLAKHRLPCLLVLQTTPCLPSPASNTPSARQKNRAYTAGIAAGVEDEKYQAKYKELKRKVKEIELDNDKLRFKVLTAKKSIQRMRLERAVLYERLSAVPPSPDLHGHHALASHAPRASSSSGQDSRQLPPLSQLPPVQSHLEHQRPPTHSQAQSPHLLPHSAGSDTRSRSHSSSSRLRGPLPSPHGYHPGAVPHPQQYSLESVPHGQQGPRSPPMGHERGQAEAALTVVNVEITTLTLINASIRHIRRTLLSPVNTRGSSSTRTHHHQRMGPWIKHQSHRYEDERQLDRERDRNGSSYRQMREEQYYASSREPIGYGRSSRADTPESASASGNGNSAGSGDGHSRLDYHVQYYNREQARPYAPRSISNPQMPSEEAEYGHEDGRPAPPTLCVNCQNSVNLPQTHRPGMDTSRKRSRNDMELRRWRRRYLLRDTIPLPIGWTIEVHQRDFIKKVLPRHMAGMMNQRRISLTSKSMAPSNLQSSILSSAEGSIPGYLGPPDGQKHQDYDSYKRKYGKRGTMGRIFPSDVFPAAMAQSWDPPSAGQSNDHQPRCPMFAHVGQPAIARKITIPGTFFSRAHGFNFYLVEHAKRPGIGVGAT